jgi:predicted CXXCH cytochrome family protein
MARKENWGTPGRSAHYVPLRRPYLLVVPALVLGGVVLAVLLLGEVVGFRSPLAPGAVSSKHAIYGTRCQECHVPREGAADVRCQRCHDPAAAGRLTNPAHVYFGSLDAKKSAAAPAVECARCHVEHRGAATVLSAVDEAQCTGCHKDKAQFTRPIGTLGQHPEFRALETASTQVTGILYSHLTHVTKGKRKKAGYVMIDRKIDSPGRTCPECHQRAPQARDFAPVTYESHCAECHKADVKMEPVAASEVVPIDAIGEETTEEWVARPADFEASGDSIARLRVHHRDEWILFNVRKLRRELDPASFAAERAALVARKSRLDRRLALANPTALQDRASLESRAAALEQELAYLDARIAAQAGAGEPSAGLDRLAEVAGAVQVAGEESEKAEASALRQRAEALKGEGVTAAALPREEFEQRRADLLRVLDEVEKADPSRKAQADEVRRRLAQLTPGDAGAELLARVREQRVAALERVRDEIRLRDSGTAPPSEALLENERKAIRTALRAVDRELREMDAIPEGRPALAPEDVDRKEEALSNLTVGCRYCHEITAQGAFAKVSVAKPVLWRATFTHKEHLTKGETCGSCHSGTRAGKQWSVETSGQSADLNFKGVDSCRECHRPGQAGQDCQKCHNYHPPVVP